MTADTGDSIVLTPVARGEDFNIISLERKKRIVVEPKAADKSVHVAGGVNQGLVVNKVLSNGQQSEVDQQPEAQLEFKVYLTNPTNDTHTLESRKLKFWFNNHANGNGEQESSQMSVAHHFFRDLVKPTEFPRDYVGFIKRMMKLMQSPYDAIRTLRIELRQLRDAGGVDVVKAIKSRLGSGEGGSNEESRKRPLTIERLLEMIEQAYPNSVSFADITKSTSSTEADIRELIDLLCRKGLIRQTENGAYIRVAYNEQEVKVVRQIPQVPKTAQPTIAIITAQYAEKLAVDAMMRNKTTYMRYQTSGDSNVYTLGFIGPFRCVSTKLPVTALSGDYRSAMIAAGNTITRLLGIFQQVEYVFVVGCGGAVPHYTDAEKHVRLGDLVVSVPTEKYSYIYVFCESAKKNADEQTVTYSTKSWRPPFTQLQSIAMQLVQEHNVDAAGFKPWLAYADEALAELNKVGAAKGEHFAAAATNTMNFNRPPSSTDKLYMSIGESQIIEVGHPEPRVVAANNTSSMRYDVEHSEPRVHLGPIAGGRHVTRDQLLRQDFASHYGCLAYDYDFDAVMESIFGNRKDNYMCIRGMADYHDGMRNKEWVPYSALMAAAFMKSVISVLATTATTPSQPSAVGVQTSTAGNRNTAAPPPASSMYASKVTPTRLAGAPLTSSSVGSHSRQSSSAGSNLTTEPATGGAAAAVRGAGGGGVAAAAGAAVARGAGAASSSSSSATSGRLSRSPTRSPDEGILI